MSDIKVIAQDSSGFIWLGAFNGLMRFDGYEFRYYTTDESDPHSLSGNDIADLEVAPDGRLWIATHDNGLNIYNPEQDNFSSYTHDPNNPDSIPDAAFFCIHFDQLGGAWLGTAHYGLYQIDMATMEFERIQELKMPRKRLTSIVNDPNDPNYLYCSDGMELWHLEIATQTFEKLSRPSVPHSYRMVGGNEKELWVNHYFYGISRYDIHKDAFQYFEFTPNQIRPTSLLPMSEAEVWVPTVGMGIMVLDVATGDWSTIRQKAFDQRSLGSDRLLTVFRDRSDNVWLGTQAGLSLYDQADQYFTTHAIKNEQTGKSMQPAFILPRPEHGDLLLSLVYDEGVALYDPETRAINFIPQRPGDRKLDGPIRLIPSEERTWIASFDGLRYINKDFSRVEPFDAGSHNDLLNSRVLYSATTDMEGRPLLMKIRGVIFRIDPIDNSVDTFQIKLIDPESRLRVIHCDHNNVLWTGSTDGLIRFNLNTEERQYYISNQEEYQFLLRGLNDILVESDSIIWIATYKHGLYKCSYDETSIHPIKRYDTQDGLAGNRPNQFLRDADGTLWVSSQNGISFYSRETDQFRSFGKRDGLLSTIVRGMDIHDGLLYAHHAEGFSIAEVEVLKQARNPVEVLIHTISIGDSTYRHRDIQALSGAQVPYHQNDLAIEYVALNYSDPQAIEYSYRLKEIQDWTSAKSNERIARYPDLEPGEYTFEIIASAGIGNPGPVSMFSIVITPPFWQTRVFQIAIGLLVIGVLWYLLKLRERQLKKEEKIKRDMAELELKALRSQMNPHFMFNSLNSIKNYILKAKPTDAAQYLSSFAHLIRMMLQNSREKTISLAQEMEALMLYIELEKMRFKQGFEFTCHIEDGLDMDAVRIPPMVLQPYVENAIWHGLMHKKSDAVLSVTFGKRNGAVECIIDDNGIGRAKAAELKSLSATRYKSMGMGITKDRIDIHNRMNDLGIQVNIEDKLNKEQQAAGTRVTVSVPAADPIYQKATH